MSGHPLSLGAATLALACAVVCSDLACFAAPLRAQSVPTASSSPSDSSGVADPNAPIVVNEPVTGNSRGVILFVRTSDDEHVIAILSTELGASAWRILEIGPDPRYERMALAALATRYGARAAVRVRESERKIELYVTGPAGAAETLTASGEQADGGVLAMRATEALRARGLQIDHSTRDETLAAVRAQAQAPADKEQEQDGAPDLSAPPWSPGRYARGLWFEVAPALVVSPGGFPAAFCGFFALRIQPVQLFSAALFGYLPWQSAVLHATEGSASITQQTLGVAGYLHPRFGRFELDFGAGALASRFAMTGQAKASWQGTSDTLLSGGVFAASGLHFNLGSGMRVSAGALFGALLARVVVHFDQRAVANFGRPFALLTLGLELPLLALGP